MFKHTLYRHLLPSDIFFINQNFKSHPATSKTTSKGYPLKPVQVLVRCRILLSDRFVHLIYPVTELISNILFFNRTLTFSDTWCTIIGILAKSFYMHTIRFI